MRQSNLTSNELLDKIENWHEDASIEYGVPSWENFFSIDVLKKILKNSVTIAENTAYCYLEDGMYSFYLEVEKIPPVLEDDLYLFEPSMIEKTKKKVIEIEIQNLQQKIEKLKEIEKNIK